MWLLSKSRVYSIVTRIITRHFFARVDGVKRVPSGATVPVNDCCGNPCGGPAA